MREKKTFSDKKKRLSKWIDYWQEPQITSRRFVLAVLLITAIPFVGVFVFLVIFLYSLFNSLDRLRKNEEARKK